MKSVTHRALGPALALALAATVVAGCGGGGSGSGSAGGDPGFESQTQEDDPNAAMVIGEDVALPADWPTVVPVPASGTANSVGVAENGSANALWVFTAPAATVASEYESLLTAAGYTKVPESDIDVEGMAGADWTGNGFALSVLASDNGDGTTSLSVNAALQE